MNGHLFVFINFFSGGHYADFASPSGNVTHGIMAIGGWEHAEEVPAQAEHWCLGVAQAALATIFAVEIFSVVRPGLVIEPCLDPRANIVFDFGKIAVAAGGLAEVSSLQCFRPVPIPAMESMENNQEHVWAGGVLGPWQLGVEEVPFICGPVDEFAVAAVCSPAEDYNIFAESAAVLENFVSL